MSEARDPDAVFEALCSNHAREILVAAEDEPRSAQSLAERCGTSLPTVYNNYRPRTSGLDPEGEGRKLGSDVFRSIDVPLHSPTTHLAGRSDIERTLPESPL